MKITPYEQLQTIPVWRSICGKSTCLQREPTELRLVKLGVMCFKGQQFGTSRFLFFSFCFLFFTFAIADTKMDQIFTQNLSVLSGHFKRFYNGYLLFSRKTVQFSNCVFTLLPGLQPNSAVCERFVIRQIEPQTTLPY